MNLTLPDIWLSLLIAFEKYNTKADLDPIQHKKELISEAEDFWRLRFIIDDLFCFEYVRKTLLVHVLHFRQ